MSLMVTHISSHGIIHATDSNLTRSDGKADGEAPKTFSVVFLNAGITVAGTYSVAGLTMNIWLDHFIREQQEKKCVSLAEFANYLGKALEKEMTQEEKEGGSMMHIAGYVEDTRGWHPEFWFVRNVYNIDMRTGEYGDFRQTFQVTEDFWQRDWPQHKLAASFKNGGYQIYTNGFTSGRVSFMILQQHMMDFFNQIWQIREWHFRPPVSLDESRLIVDLYIQTIGVLFRLSDYSAPLIGGTPQTYAIPAPSSSLPATGSCSAS